MPRTAPRHSRIDPDGGHGAVAAVDHRAGLPGGDRPERQGPRGAPRFDETVARARGRRGAPRRAGGAAGVAAVLGALLGGCAGDGPRRTIDAPYGIASTAASGRAVPGIDAARSEDGDPSVVVALGGHLLRVDPATFEVRAIGARPASVGPTVLEVAVAGDVVALRDAGGTTFVRTSDLTPWAIAGGGPAGSGSATGRIDGASDVDGAANGVLVAGAFGAARVHADAGGLRAEALAARAGAEVEAIAGDPADAIADLATGPVVARGRRLFDAAGTYLGSASAVAAVPPGSALPGACAFVRAAPAALEDRTTGEIGLLDGRFRELDRARTTVRIDDGRPVDVAVVLDHLVAFVVSPPRHPDEAARAGAAPIARWFRWDGERLVPLDEEDAPLPGLTAFAADGAGGGIAATRDGLVRLSPAGGRVAARPLPGRPLAATYDGRTVRCTTTTGAWAWTPPDPLPRRIAVGPAVRARPDTPGRTATAIFVDGRWWLGGDGEILIRATERADDDDIRAGDRGGVRARIAVPAATAFLLPAPGGDGVAWVGTDGSMALIARTTRSAPGGASAGTPSRGSGWRGRVRAGGSASWRR